MAAIGSSRMSPVWKFRGDSESGMDVTFEFCRNAGFLQTALGEVG